MDGQYLNERLKKIIENGLYRKLNVVEESTSNTIFINRKEYINFGSNDYFGISKNYEVIQEGKEVLEEFGSNICSAQTLCGYSIYHKNLAELLKNIFNVEMVNLFSSGYLANLSIFQVFPNNDTEVFIDIYSHRSLIDGARVAGVKLFFYRHLDYGMLRKLLLRSRARYKIIVSDSVFSMEATMVDLKEILKIKEENGAYLILDDAHGFMVLNNSIFDYYDVRIKDVENVIYIGTFSKAVGCLGGFLAGTELLLELIKNRASTFLFDTSLPPHICAMAKKALEILLREKGFLYVLQTNIEFINKMLNMNQKVPIFIKKFRNIKELNTAYEYLMENGLYVPAIKPPTVDEEHSRLRISLSASHTHEQLKKLVNCLNGIGSLICRD
ncbi:MAG: aminotransferase class I/II-fold pyridoxal phosphate-dependent enzyme [Planctomycetota bacterium]